MMDKNERISDLKDMAIHEVRKYGRWHHRYTIQRVPGGWIVVTRYWWHIAVTYVPMSHK
jgi:hypothetical protein